MGGQQAGEVLISGKKLVCRTVGFYSQIIFLETLNSTVLKNHTESSAEGVFSFLGHRVTAEG